MVRWGGGGASPCSHAGSQTRRHARACLLVRGISHYQYLFWSSSRSMYHVSPLPYGAREHLGVQVGVVARAVGGKVSEPQKQKFRVDSQSINQSTNRSNIVQRKTCASHHRYYRQGCGCDNYLATKRRKNCTIIAPERWQQYLCPSFFVTVLFVIRRHVPPHPLPPPTPLL